MKKTLPIGIMNYHKLKANGYYSVDKTLMIQEFLQNKSEVTLITRPRRFGKTLNLSMLAEFFDITKDSKVLFKDTKIIDTEYASEMNQYPTIFISFLNAKHDKENIIKFIKLELLTEYKKHSYVCDKMDEEEKTNFLHMMTELRSSSSSLRNVNNAISYLATCLEEYYHKKVMLFIDEYDTPFIEAHIQEFYDDLHADLATLLRTVLKGNDALQYAMLTGIQRVANENIFSDLNNMDVYSLKDEGYAEYFGFTEKETKELLRYFDLTFNEDVKTMYDGYKIGNVEIYNPWSIINYAKKKELAAYWVNTSGNKMIKKAMERSDMSFKEGYESLILHGYLDTEVDLETSFYEQSSTSSLWGLFVNAGYLTIIDTTSTNFTNEYRIRIPNKEVENEFKSLTAYHLHVDTQELSELYKSILRKDRHSFFKAYEKILLMNPSYHDLVSENSYHAERYAERMFMLGICLYIQNEYEIISNHEEGKGRCDIVLKARKPSLPSYVIELKFMKKDEYIQHPESLSNLAKEAMKQIDKQKYDIELTGEIVHIGLAHAGKEISMEWAESNV